MRANLGCGLAYVPGWTNVDASDDVKADIHLDAKDFIAQHGQDTTELYMGHFIEHLLPDDALDLLRSTVSALPEGAEVSAVIPDIRQIFHAYEAAEVGNRELNEWYIYSYIQPSHHLWCYDEESLAELFRAAGFDDVVPIEPATWPPVWHKTGQGARFQSGVRGAVPAKTGNREPLRDAQLPEIVDKDDGKPPPEQGATTADSHAESAEERVNQLVRMVGVEGHLRYTAEALRAATERELEDVRAQLDSIRRSRSYRLAVAGRGVVRTLVPEGSARGRAIRRVARRLRTPDGQRDGRV